MVVRYREYRDYDKRRIDINDSMMALLAGSQLASHMLQLTDGSQYLLGEIFPNVTHIARFNRTSDVARKILLDAESHLGAMAVPYALALHEDYIIGATEFLVEVGIMTANEVQNLNASKMHSAFADACGASFSEPLLQVFHLIRRMRNCQIHAGGRANQSVVNYLDDMNLMAKQLWQSLTHAPLPVLEVGTPIIFEQKELGATLAATKRLAEEANGFLATVYPRSKWAHRLVADWRTEFGSRQLNPVQTLRKVRGFSRMYYGELALTDAEIEQALDASGQAQQT